MDYPEYLYHYTSIETLALIMSKRCIRFNCLKFVDDPEENVSSDIKQSGKLCLVSCYVEYVYSKDAWSKIKNEIISI